LDSEKKIADYHNQANKIASQINIWGSPQKVKKQIEDMDKLGKLIEEEKKNAEELKKKLAEAEKEWKENLTSTTAENLADAIVEGFKKGQNAAEVFANNFRNVMMDAMGEVMKRQIMDMMIKGVKSKGKEDSPGFYDQFSEAMSDGVLTPQEKKALGKTYQDIIDASKKTYDGIQDVLGGLPGSDEATANMTGAIKGITENTAGKLEGQINAMRINVVDQLEVARQGLDNMIKIELNTRQLYEIKNILIKISASSTDNSMRANGW
jgi:hypothetical protein